MALPRAEQERLISLVAHQHSDLRLKMIHVKDPARPPSVRDSSSSRLGDLDLLPLELLHAIFAMLDIRTLSDVSRTCLRGVAVVKSLPEYRDLMQHAPEALTALGVTGLAHLHSIATIHEALTSTDCVSCGFFGPCLFLPTCQRCCPRCLAENQSFWVIPRLVAQTCFGLSPTALETLSTMRCVSGEYHAGQRASPNPSHQLVCVGSAKRLTIAEDQSEQTMRDRLEARLAAGYHGREYDAWYLYQRAPLTPPGPGLLNTCRMESFLLRHNHYRGMASIAFPHHKPGFPTEHGIWCHGCQHTESRWFSLGPMPSYIRRQVPSDKNADYYGGTLMHNLVDIARLSSDFLDHIGECPGAKFLFERGENQRLTRAMQSAKSTLKSMPALMSELQRRGQSLESAINTPTTA